MSRPKYSIEELIKIRSRWWEQYFDLIHEIHGLKRVSKAKKRQLADSVLQMISTFNAAWFQDPGYLDTRPPARRRRQPAKPKVFRRAGEKTLRLVPPPTVH